MARLFPTSMPGLDIRKIWWCLLPLAALAIHLRDPAALEAPRFWAEEGAIYFAKAWTAPATEALLAPHQGYYSLVPNLATLLAARWTTPELAPLVTALVAFLIQLLPIAVVLRSRHRYWRLPERRLLFCALLIFGPSTGGVWMTTITSQFHLGMLVFLLYLETTARARGRVDLGLRLGLLVLASLTGVMGVALTPLFVARWWRSRRRDHALLLFPLALGLFVQGLAIAASRLGWVEVLAQDRPLAVPTPGLATWVVVFRLLIEPLFGELIASELAVFSRSPRLFEIVGTALFVGVLVLAWRRRWTPLQCRLGLAVLISLALLFLGALGEKWDYATPGFGARYFFQTQLLALCLIAPRPRRGSRLAKGFVRVLPLLAALLVATLLDPQTVRPQNPGPNWRSEVAEARRTPAYAPKSWPAGWWVPIALNDGPSSTRELGRSGADEGESRAHLQAILRPEQSLIQVRLRTTRPDARGYLSVAPAPFGDPWPIPGHERCLSYLYPVPTPLPVMMRFQSDERGQWMIDLPIPPGFPPVRGRIQAIVETPGFETSNAVEFDLRPPSRR